MNDEPRPHADPPNPDSSTSKGAGPDSRGAVPPALRAASWLMLLVGAALLGGVAATCASGLRLAPELPPVHEVETVVRPTPDVISAMRDLARLQTAEAHIERVIDLRERHRHAFGLIEAEDAILLVAAGDVQAGVDLTELREGDVVIDELGGAVSVTLPPARVFQTRLDNGRTYVHTRRTDMLARRSQSLETRARQEAERTMEEAAIEAGLLHRAQSNAESVLRELIEALGYSDVAIDWRSSPGREE